jgi:hypothetical protein
MPLSVVTVAAGGLAVADVTATRPGLGLPVMEAISGYGIPVTRITNGLPVCYVSVISTWSPTDKSAGVTLSNNNLTYTGSGGARSSKSLTAGKAYWEVLLNQGSGEAGGAWNIGFSDVATTFAQMQSTGVILMVLLLNGNIANGGGATIGAAIANGDTVCIAADLTGKKAWFRKNGGNWNNSGANNPATDVGGVVFGAAGPYYACLASSQSSTSYTANFGASAFAFTKPSGFSAWNDL